MRAAIDEKMNKHDSLRGILWGLFSATATVSAFLLPAHIFAVAAGFEISPFIRFSRFYLFIVLFSALYHGLYRTKTIFHDLGFGNYEKIISFFFYILVLTGTGLAGYLSFFLL